MLIVNQKDCMALLTMCRYLGGCGLSLYVPQHCTHVIRWTSQTSMPPMNNYLTCKAECHELLRPMQVLHEVHRHECDTLL